ncbi:MAG: hypothetical protein LQ340_000300 [Diploschistes diacapsis]|nr:MAG: hypothetical protein LQ340_000300 [Diploschistes diacapsis]
MPDSKQGPIGQTIASSGYRISRFGHMMDGSVVEVADKNFRKNYTLELQDLPFMNRPDDYADVLTPGTATYATDSLDVDEWVVLRGRSSGVSTGKVHRMDYEANGWPVDGLGVYRDSSCRNHVGYKIRG